MNHIPAPNHVFFLQSRTFSCGDILHIRHFLFPVCYSEMGSGRGVLVPESPISRTPKGAISLPRDCEKHEACQTLNICTAVFGKTHECFSLCVLSLNNILFMVCTLDSCLTFQQTIQLFRFIALLSISVCMPWSTNSKYIMSESTIPCA